MKFGRIVSGWTIVALFLVIVIIAGSVFIALKCNTGQALEITLTPEREITGMIYVGGAVNNPGYYPVFAGDTLQDIVEAAGGLKEGASLDNVEFTIDEADKGATPQKININRAAAWLLEALPGVGEVRAQAIIEYRQEHGLFHDINELMNVPGFGESSFDKVKDLITVND
jgi:competence protein ComEA